MGEGGVSKNLNFSLFGHTHGGQGTFIQNSKIIHGCEIWPAKVGAYTGIFINFYSEIHIFGDQ